MSECFKIVEVNYIGGGDVDIIIDGRCFKIEHPISHQGPIEMVEVPVWSPNLHNLKVDESGEVVCTSSTAEIIGHVELPRCTKCGLFVKGEKAC